ncbi:NAD(P)-binding domain-containing protein [uncultured Tateyamaria sp.]|uniref:NADPH-dependent F420 reductase n=1 Tax=uncultured Tateyamaria sp. TaxID=455651 RepID=UPI00261081CF|nr:NAD(P)-binding domain-containing protein [uncultured Tateyamaria sp.]
MAKLGVKAEHTVFLGSRTPVKEQVSLASACADSDMVILAMPYTAARDTLVPLAAAIGNKIVVDATNPLNDDRSPLQLGESTSAGENVPDWLPQARVVKAFNIIFADIMTK